MSELKRNFFTTFATTVSYAEAADAERGRMHALLGRPSVARVLPWRRLRLRGGLCALGGAAALALLLTLPTTPAHAECGTTVEQGTYDPDADTFTPGTSATDTDIRFECTESDTDDNSYISFESLPEDAIPDDLGPGSYVVVDLNGTNNFLPSTDIDPYWIVRSSGIETTDPIWAGDGVAYYNLAGNSLRVEVRAPITTRGDGARGVFVWATGGGSATAINRGTVNTHGGVDYQLCFRSSRARHPSGFRLGGCLRHELRSHRDPWQRSGRHQCVWRHRRHGGRDQLRDRNRSWWCAYASDPRRRRPVDRRPTHCCDGGRGELLGWRECARVEHGRRHCRGARSSGTWSVGERAWGRSRRGRELRNGGHQWRLV